MSKMSRFNLSLQEVANELGYYTVGEAMDAGYSITELSAMREGV